MEEEQKRRAQESAWRIRTEKEEKGMRKTYRIIAAILCAVTILGAPVQAQAAAGAYIKQSEYDSFRALFDAQYYYNKYGDLQQVIGYDEEKLFEHYMTYGIFEGRSGCAEFNLLYYMKNNEDVKAAFGNNYTAYCKHYLEYGRAEQRTAATAELFTAEPTNELGRYTTYYDTTEERALNVEVAASRINGVVLQPGEKFSFSRTILPRTRANGYGMGPVIIGGKIVRGMGGGICQVSSTLYAAMVMAGVPATERYPHSLRMDYIPRGMDATIAGTAKDLKFVNPYSYPIVITAVTEAGSLTVSLAPYEVQ